MVAPPDSRTDGGRRPKLRPPGGLADAPRRDPCTRGATMHDYTPGFTVRVTSRGPMPENFGFGRRRQERLPTAGNVPGASTRQPTRPRDRAEGGVCVPQSSRRPPSGRRQREIPRRRVCGAEAGESPGTASAPRNSDAERQPRENCQRTGAPRRGGLARYSTASAGGSFRCPTKVSSRSNLSSTRAARSLNF